MLDDFFRKLLGKKTQPRHKNPRLHFATGEPFSREKWNRIEDNLYKLNDDFTQKRVRFQSRPLMLEYSTNNQCNLRCIMCRPEGIPPFTLPPKLVQEVLIDELMPDAVVLVPSSGSEPFMGDLTALAEGCRKHEVQMNLITNGTLMTRDRLEPLAPVLARLHVSLDGHRPEIYESIRIGARFDHVVRNVKVAGEIAHIHGFELLLTSVLSIAMVPEMAEFVRFAADLGADGVEFQKIIHATEQAAKMDALTLLEKKEIKAAQEKATKAAESAGIDIHFNFDRNSVRVFNPRKRKRLFGSELEQMMLYFQPDFCFMAASYVKVGPDGMVLPGCIGTESLIVGNLLEESFDTIWNGERYQKLRKALFDKVPLHGCKDCLIINRKSSVDFP